VSRGGAKARAYQLLQVRPLSFIKWSQRLFGVVLCALLCCAVLACSLQICKSIPASLARRVPVFVHVHVVLLESECDACADAAMHFNDDAKARYQLLQVQIWTY
jgi:hypothetical protein